MCCTAPLGVTTINTTQHSLISTGLASPLTLAQELPLSRPRDNECPMFPPCRMKPCTGNLYLTMWSLESRMSGSSWAISTFSDRSECCSATIARELRRFYIDIWRGHNGEELAKSKNRPVGMLSRFIFQHKLEEEYSLHKCASPLRMNRNCVSVAPLVWLENAYDGYKKME